jgi:hypothetical protein
MYRIISGDNPPEKRNVRHNRPGTMSNNLPGTVWGACLNRCTVPYWGMPRPGYHTVTIPDSVYAKLTALAKQQNNTVPRIIANLVNAQTRKSGGR